MPLYALGDRTPVIHPTAYVHPDAVVIGDVELADEVNVWPGAVLRGDFGRISVGSRTSVQDGTVLHTTAKWPTVIGADCVVGHLAHLEGCVVADRCLVGSGSVVLNGAVIGADCVVGAGAVVREGAEIPAGHLAVGVPARLHPAPDGMAGWVANAVRSYVGNAARYRDELRLLPGDPPHPVPDPVPTAPSGRSGG